MREPTDTLVADEEYPSPDLLEPDSEVPTANLVAISDDAIPVRAVEEEQFAAICVRVAAEYFVPFLDGRASMTEIGDRTGLSIDIVRAAILRLAVQGALTFAPPRPAPGTPPP